MARYGLICCISVVFALFIFYNFFFETTPVYKKNGSKAAALSDILYKFKNVLVNTTESSSQSSNVPDRCEVLHIGLVCAGYKSNLQLYTMLKSLLFYCRNPIHFHIMVNTFSGKVLKTLFDTWDVPQVNVTFYNISDHILDVRWIPNSHYSGVHGLLKLTYPKFIPLSVTNRLVILDTDLTFSSDITLLFQLFDKFNRNQAIGLVDNESDYYLKKSSWPAIGRGYNTGVILYNLEVLKRLHWSKLWEQTAKKIASFYGATKLADQDIINAVIKENPEIVYKVPCYWNTQLSDQSLSHNCYKNNDIKVVHWNSPKKFQVINKDGDYFRSIHTSFLEYNGNLLTKRLYDCSSAVKSDQADALTACSAFEKAVTKKWRTLLFFRKYEYIPMKNDVTFAVHLSSDRLHLIEELCEHWAGPMSVTLYVTDPEFHECNRYLDNLESLQGRNDIAFHAVFKEGEYYPINVLRNVGLKNIDSPYVFLADIDFLPMVDTYSNIKNSIASLKTMDKQALVVPAFETQRYRSRFPRSKTELLQMIDNRKIFTFRFDVWAAGHAPTNYQKWRTAKVPYPVKWERDYEPYVVVSKEVVEYDNRFMGFGWNKVSHIMELEAQGYSFVVLPNVFIVHKPHAPSYDIIKFRESPTYRMCLQNLKDEFVAMLFKKYGRTFESRTNTFVPVPEAV